MKVALCDPDDIERNEIVLPYEGKKMLVIFQLLIDDEIIGLTPQQTYLHATRDKSAPKFRPDFNEIKRV